MDNVNLYIDKICGEYAAYRWVTESDGTLKSTQLIREYLANLENSEDEFKNFSQAFIEAYTNSFQVILDNLEEGHKFLVHRRRAHLHGIDDAIAYFSVHKMVEDVEEELSDSIELLSEMTNRMSSTASPLLIRQGYVEGLKSYLELTRK